MLHIQRRIVQLKIYSGALSLLYTCSTRLFVCVPVFVCMCVLFAEREWRRTEDGCVKAADYVDPVCTSFILFSEPCAHPCKPQCYLTTLSVFCCMEERETCQRQNVQHRLENVGNGGDVIKWGKGTWAHIFCLSGFYVLYEKWQPRTHAGNISVNQKKIKLTSIKQ